MTYVIRPLPHKAPHQSRIPIKRLDVLRNGARSVAHCMRELAHYKRFLPVILFSVLNHLIDRRVHAAKYVSRMRLLIALVMYETGVVDLFNLVVHSLVVPPIEGLVSEGPHDDAWMIFIPLDQLAGTVYICFPPIRIVRGETSGVAAHLAEAVALEVCLVKDQRDRTALGR